MNKKLRLLFLLGVLLSTVSAVAYDFSYTYNGNTLYYRILSIADKTVEVTLDNFNKYSFSGHLDIPETVTYNSITYSVTTIGVGAFKNCTGLTSVTIPNSVTTIGSDAFKNCTGLTSVTIPNYVTTIGVDAFCGCTGLTSMTIPNYVTFIGDYAFKDCTALTSITIPNTVTYIGERAFDGTALFDDKSNWENGVLYIGNHLIKADRSEFRAVTYNIKEGTLTIAFGAFYYCSSLTSVTIPNSVTSINDLAFHNCSSLTSVTIPNSVTSIGMHVFDGTALYKKSQIGKMESFISVIILLEPIVQN